MVAKNMVLLFDESGAPNINNDQRTDWFIGVGVAYEQSNEEIIFSKCQAEFGLANSKPLKNDRITNTRVVSIVKVLEDLPMSIYVTGVNTANPILRRIIVDYERFGEEIRENFRRIRKRPIPQIIHSHVLDHCLFNLITGYFEEGGSDAMFTVFIDNWSISKNNINILLRYRATSLYEKISLLCSNFNNSRLISIAPLELLNKDSSRKRFIDVLASTFSRSYLNPNSQKYSRKIIELIQECGSAHFIDATQHSIDIMKAVMRGTPDNG